MSASTFHREPALTRQPLHVPDHELIRPIGSGSYGEVWLARSALGTLRALKVVYRCDFEDEHPFKREFNGIEQFEPISRTHDGLVDILQVGRTDEYFYYVMELADAVGSGVPGNEASQSTHARALESTGNYVPRTLQSDLRHRGRLPVDDCVQVGLALAGALTYLHERGLVHRDLKPSNIIFVEGAPKLADVGLVARADEAQSLVGTIGFIPPEGSGTPRADLFSLGKVLYEMATGKDRREFPQLPAQLREFPDAEQLVEFNEILLKACANNPSQRYGSAAEMRSDLALLQGGRSVRRLHAMERRLAMATRAGLVLAALLVLAGGFYFAARRQAETNARLASTNASLATANARLAEDTVRQLYGAEMNLAFQAWHAGNIPRARTLLEKHRMTEPGLRGFEFGLLEQLCGESDARFTLFGHTGVVWNVAISPEAGRLVTAGADGLLKIWDASTGTLLTNLPGSTRAIHAVAFSPDGKTLASGGRDGMVVLWEAGSWVERQRLKGHRDAIRALAFSADGRILASGGEANQLLLWNASSSSLIVRLPETMAVEQIAFSPDGRWLAAVGTDFCVHLWDVARRERRLIARQRSLLKAVVFSPDGRMIAAAGYDGVTELWDVAADQPAGALGHGAPVRALAFSPSGGWLATAGADANIHVWDVRTRQRLRQFRGHGAVINALAVPAAGDWLASAADDGTVRIWETDAVREHRSNLNHDGLVNGQAYFSGGSRLATASGSADELRIWDPTQGKLLSRTTTETDAMWCLGASADATVFFSGGVDGSLRRWQMSEISSRQTHIRHVHTHAVEAVGVSPDGRLVATACRGAPIKLWDAGTLDEVATLPGEARTFRTVAFSPNGQWLAAGGLAAGRGRDVLVWNVPQRSFLVALGGHGRVVRSVAFAPDGATLATGDDARSIRLWDMATQKLTARLEGHDAPIQSLAFAPDGRTLASGSEDSTVKLWNLRLQQEVATLRGHVSQVRQVAFSPDGDVLATASGDGMVRLWRTSHYVGRSR